MRELVELRQPGRRPMTIVSWADLGIAVPIVAAPMAGGPTTPALVIAAARSGGVGFLAGGYRTADSLAEQIRATRDATPTFGVNLFVPNPIPVDPSRYRRYRDALLDLADRFGVTLPADPVEHAGDWHDEVDLLVADPVPIVSFTFGIPPRLIIDRLHAAGTILIQTVTAADEAEQARDAGVDALAVQASVAGGHSGTLTPDLVRPDTPLLVLVAEIRRAVDLPVIAAGGVTRPAQVAGAIRAGAEAVMVGTALLRSDESGASTGYRTALADPDRGDTMVTRAFTGRPARTLRNTFVYRYDEVAPAGFPAIHHLTAAIRQASTAAGDPEFVSLWAGAGYRDAADGPAEDILRRLADDL